MGSASVGVQCPLTSLGEFLGYWAGWYPGLPTVLVSIAFPFAFHISVFSIHSSSPAIGFHSCFFFTVDVSALILDPSLTHFLGEFPGLGLALVPALWSQRRNSRPSAHGAEISIQISALAGVEPRTLASSGRESYR